MGLPIQPTDALIVVDMQYDFLPGGALAIANADRLVPIINQCVIKFDHVAFTRDWHPANHNSFSANPAMVDGSWPPHCVQGTPRAAFHEDLTIPSTALIVSKADRPDLEAYSGFQHTNLNPWLQARQVNRVFIAGVATDYCVKHTALDSAQLGLTTWVIKDAVKGVHESSDQALMEMQQQGVNFIISEQLERP